MRPTTEQIRNHPWMQTGTFDMEATRTTLLTTLASKQPAAEKPVFSGKPVKVKRGSAMV